MHAQNHHVMTSSPCCNAHDACVCVYVVSNVLVYVCVSSERKNVRQVDEIDILYSHYCNVLAYSLQQTHPKTHNCVLGSVFKLLPRLHDIKVQQTEVIGQFQPHLPPGAFMSCDFSSTCRRLRS